MIYVNIRGRLGNQMFSYAMARNIQEETGDKIVLCGGLQKKQCPEYDMVLFKFMLNENVSYDENKKFPWYANIGFPVTRLFRKCFPGMFFKLLSRVNIFIWLGQTYKRIMYDKRRDIYLDGYWQTDKYFEKIREILLEEFLPRNELLSKNLFLWNEIKHTESVCISIRRGNYITNKKNKKMFYVCDEAYFKNAIEIMGAEIKNATWFVFSDEIEWVKKNMKFPGKVYFESGIDDVDEKIRLMSNCKHFIISNSSFSWWAQYLSNYSNKKVVAPKMWYADGRKADIVMDTWILI